MLALVIAAFFLVYVVEGPSGVLKMLEFAAVLAAVMFVWEFWKTRGRS